MTRRHTIALMAAAPLVLPSFDAGAAGTAKAFTLHDTPLPMPEVAFVYEDGRPGSLADFRGKHVLLNVWATWCPPCREEMPTLDRLQDLLGGEDFHVLPLSIDRAGVKVVQDFYAKTGIKHLEIYMDEKAQVMHRLKLGGLPTTFLIGPNGEQLGVLVGPAEWDAPALIALFRDQIAISKRERR
ncbi:TlpA family protein disulfide reductase [bacterium SCSIO 12827]|nr:TlpA family protein disulfide reductase [bacterium SCSIO 12827]